MCGMSMLQSLLLNTEESERWYRELQKYAKEHTGSERRSAKGKILYLDIGLPHRGSDHMVEILKNAYLLLLDKEVKMQEFSVTSNQASQMNGGKDFCEWSKRDRELAGSIGKIVEFVLGKYGKGLVNLALAESFLKRAEIIMKLRCLQIREECRRRQEARSSSVLSETACLPGFILLPEK